MGKVTFAVLVFASAAATAIVAGDDATVDYPVGYRTWQHVKSMIIQPGHALEQPFGGIHHIYANAKAMEGLTSGNYAEGAIFVFDLLAYEQASLTIVEKDRKRIDVMQFDPARFANTGGWGYDTFVRDSTSERLAQDVVEACYTCHQAAKESNYVFSRYRR